MRRLLRREKRFRFYPEAYEKNQIGEISCRNCLRRRIQNFVGKNGKRYFISLPTKSESYIPTDFLINVLSIYFIKEYENNKIYQTPALCDGITVVVGELCKFLGC